jgi:hypothetical protein
MSKGAKAVVQVLEHDPEKLQIFRTRSCSKSKTLERYPIQSEWTALLRFGRRARPPGSKLALASVPIPLLPRGRGLHLAERRNNYHAAAVGFVAPGPVRVAPWRPTPALAPAPISPQIPRLGSQSFRVFLARCLAKPFAPLRVDGAGSCFSSSIGFRLRSRLCRRAVFRSVGGHVFPTGRRAASNSG